MAPANRGELEFISTDKTSSLVPSTPTNKRKTLRTTIGQSAQISRTAERDPAATTLMEEELSETRHPAHQGTGLYRSNPVEVFAIQYLGEGADGNDIKTLLDFGVAVQTDLDIGDHVIQIWNQLENQWINCPVGHYVIKGTKGEFYPCDPEVMYNKYIFLGAVEAGSDGGD